MSGWIKLHREILENDFWSCEPFTRGQAWVDLLLLANHKPSFFFKRGNRVDVERGQLGRSEVELSDRWKWSRSKVRKFLKDLEKEQQISITKSTVTQIVTIVKYDEYQSEEQQKNNRKTAEEQQKDTYKNEKNKKNNKGLDLSSFSGEKLELVKEWISYRTEKKKKLTQKSVDLLSKKMKEHSVASCEAVINKSISNGWTGLFWDNIPKENNNEGFKLDLNNL